MLVLTPRCCTVACGLGITAGYHRLFAHRTYNPVAPVRWALLAFGAATFQNSALSWSADHRAHHADTDGVGDPHAVTLGAWFAHLGWLFRRREASADVTRLTDLGAVTSIRLQHRFYVVIAVGVGLGASDSHRRPMGGPVGRAPRRRVPAHGSHAAGDVLCELTRGSDRQAALRHALVGP